MVWVLSAVVIVIIGAAVMAASGRFGAVPPVVDDRPAPDLPPGPLGPEDLRGASFAVVARGYSMAQVDSLLERLAGQLGQASGRAEEEPTTASEEPSQDPGMTT
ncbi:DivIVA domain-containing protein [Acidipropionibacterium virtanenii]|uniref:DivIVA domain-containing protein n=1 Tax=Acidipropionibacterium virtanenii TaxID=2057246 RepID=A0A344UVL2_9ACTN|nr:hypothetical protein JS278_02158 [Acidipropionibacterium virtanenii]